MKILALSYLFPNSQKPDFGIFVLNRLRHVHAHCPVTVINPVPWFPLSFLFRRYRHIGRIPRREVLGGLEVFHPRFFIIPGVFKALDALTFALSVLMLLYRSKPDFDLVDLHWTYPDLLSGRLISWFFRKKQLVTVRGREALCPGEKSIRSWLIRWGLKGSDRVISLSDELKQEVLDLGVSKERVHTIRNGVDLSVFQHMDQLKARQALRLPEAGYLVLSVGSLIFRKGHDRVIKSFARLHKSQPDAHLYILGSHGPEGDYRNELIRLVESLSLTDGVTFVGQIPNMDLVLWYNAADLFCLLSRGEGSPNVLTEALACGCPSVATDVGCVTDILTHRFMGQVVPNKGARIYPTFTEVALRDYDRPKIASHMKAFGWEWCAENVLTVYRKLMTS